MNTVQTKHQTGVKTHASETIQAGVESISRVSLVSMSAITALVGLWAVACFAVATINNGPIAMFKGWVASLVGM